jgi:acetyltransferase-like isoleucine patch superfamily enzyme
MSRFFRFIKKYNKKILFIIAEEYIGFFVRYLPGYLGFLLRFIFYKPLFKRLKFLPLIYPGTYFTHSYGISIGKNFSINSGCVIDGRGGIVIGDNVMIGPNTVIVSSSHQYNNIDKPMTYLDHVFSPVIIENDVWIGANVFIKGGVRIKSHSIIAAGSVVLNDIEEYSIVGGIPAKFIKDRRKQ